MGNTCDSKSKEALGCDDRPMKKKFRPVDELFKHEYAEDFE